MAPRTGRPRVEPEDKARSYPVSLRQVDIDALNAIKAMTGESHGRIVARLVKGDLRRLERRAAKNAAVTVLQPLSKKQ